MTSQQPSQENITGKKDSLKLQQLLQQRHKPQRKLWLIALGVVIAGALLYWLLGASDTPSLRYVTDTVQRGELIVRVSATGNLQPTNQVDVGSELSGIIEAVLVDDNDQVSAGQVLARLDRSKLSDAVAISKANLSAAEARVLQADATVTEARANLKRLKEVARLSGGKVPSQSDLDTAEASLKRAEADVASAKAAVVQAGASLQSNQTNLDKALIRSPINGVVLSRQVEPGQTVAASFQAPVLFTLAEDLSQMELQVDIDEADVGQVKLGQTATFSVDAWPQRHYPATIMRVGYGAIETEGVVSYPATLTVDNSDLSLRPGMTATAEITTLVHENALLVPNAALRFSPPKEDKTEAGGGSVLSSLLPRRPRHNSRQVTIDTGDGSRQLWLLRDDEAVAVTVQVGASNGAYTEITGGDLQEGAAVITEAVSRAK